MSSSRIAKPLPLGAARWTRGFWAERFATCRDATIPSMGRLMTDIERVRFLGNFEVAIGHVEGRHRGPKWNDGDFYKWLEAAASLQAFERDEKLAAEIDQLVALIAKTQEPDGYIHTDVQIARRAGQDVPRFGNPMDFEMYNMGHLLTAACVHHAATGKTNLLATARKAADYLAQEFSSPTPQQARHGICPSHLMALIDLARVTNEPRYAQLAKTLLDMRNLVERGDDDNQDRVPLRQESRAVGHAVRGTYLWAGAADVLAETGDETLRKPIERIWDDLVGKKLYITGGCGALFDGASPDGAVDQTTITRVHQAFGRDYQLPSATAHNETCAAIGNALWNWRMFLLSGEAKYCDLLEHTLLNSVLAGVSLDGESYFYTNTLRRLSPMPVEQRWSRKRQKTIGCFCCPPNVARTVAQSSRYAYATSDHGVYIVMYGASRLQIDDLALTQETEYPWDGRVRITIDAAPKVERSIFLRVPAWAQDANIRVGGVAEPARPRAGSFHELRRVWSSGDVIELDLPMPVGLIEANPYVEEARNHAAVMRGPLVYCLESNDLPAGVRLLDVYLPRDAKLSPRATKELAGATVLEGKALAAAHTDWSENQLHRELSPGPMKEFHLVLIPYYAWDNRGESEMTIWLPLASYCGD
ncbi:MAG TPA: glycoside hydrolase family 127 protein [Tepidisphaeraceae bacterium]|nr:glycoside hydrolase family 127 protein [Tepidisphaeraceae bacterium]